MRHKPPLAKIIRDLERGPAESVPSRTRKIIRDIERGPAASKPSAPAVSKPSPPPRPYGSSRYTPAPATRPTTPSASPDSRKTASPTIIYADDRTHVNRSGGARQGQKFVTFTRSDRPGYTYHEYVVDGKRRVYAVKTKREPPPEKVRQYAHPNRPNVRRR